MDVLIQIFLAAVTIIAVFAVMRYQTAETKKNLAEYQVSNGHTIEAIEKIVEANGKAIVALETNQQHNITAKEVREQYISRELFEMQVKHIDHRFNNIDTTLGNILAAVQNKNGGRE
ncbi:hypothetical protein [Sulfuricurvum sp.]|uniref:hypothetical protein n=1 Tax=Sulfuricurvum sp. TaxID=2025608 RepID=UPI003BB0A128